MTFIYLWIYTLVLIFVWWFFIVAKLHTDKFKNFSPYIKIVTKFLAVFLIILSIIWYILIFNLPNSNPSSAKLEWLENIWNSTEEFNKLDFNEINY